MDALLIYLGLALLSFIPLGLFFFLGSTIEKNHLQDLESRERALRDMLVTDLRQFPMREQAQTQTTIVTGEAVLAADAFKNWMLGWRSIFGGEVVSFRKLMDRARREALARLLEDAKRQGYNAVCNVRYDSADLGGAVHARNKNAGKKIAILASATAYHARKQAAAQMALPGPELNLHSHPVAAAPVPIQTS